MGAAAGGGSGCAAGGGGEERREGLSGAVLEGGAMTVDLTGGGGLGLPLPGEPLPAVPLFSTGRW